MKEGDNVTVKHPAEGEMMGIVIQINGDRVKVLTLAGPITVGIGDIK